MAHNVETMAYAGVVPWHGLGVSVPADLTPEQMLQAADLNWEVQKFPTFAILDDNDPDSVIETGQSALVRTSDKKMLDVVSDDWNPVQNAEAFEFFNEFVMAGDMEMHTAGSLKGGQIVWALAKVKESFELFKGDQVDSYLLFTNPHKFGQCIDVRFTPIRVVCVNTLAAAHNNKASSLIRIRHTRSSQTNLENVRDIMDNINAQFEATAEQYRFLASRDFNQNDVRKYVKVLLGIEKTADDIRACIS